MLWNMWRSKRFFFEFSSKKQTPSQIIKRFLLGTERFKSFKHQKTSKNHHNCHTNQPNLPHAFVDKNPRTSAGCSVLASKESGEVRVRKEKILHQSQNRWRSRWLMIMTTCPPRSWLFCTSTTRTNRSLRNIFGNRRFHDMVLKKKILSAFWKKNIWKINFRKERPLQVQTKNLPLLHCRSSFNWCLAQGGNWW